MDAEQLENRGGCTVSISAKFGHNFFCGNSFAGIDQCIVTTYAYNLNAARQIVSFLDNTGVKYRLAIGEDQWGAWKQISTATPPQEFSLPLADGIGGSARYIKTQESIVYIFGWITGAHLESEIAILPEGFRPKYNVVATASASSNDTTNSSVRIRFSTDGRIVAEKADDTNALKNGLSIVGCFLANNS